MIRVPLDVRNRLRTALPRILSHVPSASHRQFKRSVISAVGEYLETCRPEAAQQEIKKLHEDIEMGRVSPHAAWAALSPQAQERVKMLDPITTPLPDPAITSAVDFGEAILKRIAAGAELKTRRGKSVLMSKVVGKMTRGRPPRDDVDMLVARLAGAYVGAAGKAPTKRRGTQNKRAFEDIMEEVFSVVGLPVYGGTLKHALDRYWKSRRELEANNWESYLS